MINNIKKVAVWLLILTLCVGVLPGMGQETYASEDIRSGNYSYVALEDGNIENVIIHGDVEVIDKTSFHKNNFLSTVYYSGSIDDCDKVKICEIVSKYYNQKNNTNIYVAFEDECFKTEEGYMLMLRNQGGNSANVLVTTLVVNMNTGEVKDDWGYTWNLYDFSSEIPVPSNSPNPSDLPNLTETTIKNELGHVDDNGTIDAGDALCVLKYAAKLSELTEAQIFAADVTKDRKVDAADALLILKHAAKLISNFEGEYASCNGDYNKLLKSVLIPEFGIASQSFDAWANLDSYSVFGSVNDSDLGLFSALEYDCNFDGINELLTFYIKQENLTISGSELSTQKIYIDLYTKSNNEIVYLGTIDILEPVIPWSSVFAITDEISCAIKTYNDKAYLYVERFSTNEGPVQDAVYVYDLTDISSIQSCSYYCITDAGRYDGKLMIPATINGGSSGEHTFVAKVAGGNIELYYEEYWGERDDSFGSMKCQTISAAMDLINSELDTFGYNLIDKEDVVFLIEYSGENDGLVQIYDLTLFEDNLNKENNLDGTWKIDVEKTNKENSDTLSNIFGSGIKYGYEMFFSPDGQFEYYIGIGIGGKGSYSQQGNQIQANIITYEEETSKELMLQIVNEDGEEYIVLDYDLYQIYWKKQ